MKVVICEDQTSMVPFEYQQLDSVMHGKVRLGIMAILQTTEEAEFISLRDSLKTTDGNLSVHLRKLEEAGYVEVKKVVMYRKPVSSYRISARGSEAFKAYLKAIGRLIHDQV